MASLGMHMWAHTRISKRLQEFNEWAGPAHICGSPLLARFQMFNKMHHLASSVGPWRLPFSRPLRALPGRHRGSGATLQSEFDTQTPPPHDPWMGLVRGSEIFRPGPICTIIEKTSKNTGCVAAHLHLANVRPCGRGEPATTDRVFSKSRTASHSPGIARPARFSFKRFT